MTQVSESERRQVYGDLNMFYPTVSMLYTDEQEMLASAQTIHELGEKIIFFGHGKPKQNGSWK